MNYLTGTRRRRTGLGARPAAITAGSIRQTTGVFGELAHQPAGCGLRADESEQAARCQFRRPLPSEVEQPKAFELIFPDQRGDQRPGQNCNGGVALNLVLDAGRRPRLPAQSGSSVRTVDIPSDAPYTAVVPMSGPTTWSTLA